MRADSTPEQRRAMVDRSRAAAANAKELAPEFLGLTRSQAQQRADQVSLRLRWVDVPCAGTYCLTDDRVFGRLTLFAVDGVVYEVDVDDF